MLNKKLSDIFSKKEERQKNSNRVDRTQFDESYFSCRLAYHPHKLSLIKLNATIAVGSEAGTPMMIKCRWFIKKANQYSEIQGITSSCYQPCVDDVGNSICVQIQPIIEGKTYTGGLITKETNPLELGVTLETKFTEQKNMLYRNSQSLNFSIKIEQINLLNQQFEEEYQLPEDATFLISKQQEYDFDLKITMNNKKFKACYWITKKYPEIQFIRKSYNSLIIWFNEEESMRVAFSENMDRQILALLIKTLVANSSIDDFPKQIKVESSDAHHEQQSIDANLQEQKFEEKEEGTPQENQVKIQNESDKLNANSSSSVSHSFDNLKLKQDEDTYTSIQTGIQCKNQVMKSQNSLGNSDNELYQAKINKLMKQLASAKDEHSNLMKKYNIDKQMRLKLQKQVKKLGKSEQQFNKITSQNKTLQEKMEKVQDMDRFYKNQISLLKKQLKKTQNQNKILSQEHCTLKQHLKSIQNSSKGIIEQRPLKTINQMEMQKKGLKISELLEINENLKNEVERLQNVLTATHKKVDSLSLQRQFTKTDHPKSQPHITYDPQNSKIVDILKKKDKIISDLEFKVTNLENILKYKNGDAGNQLFSLQKIINSMTQNITQKQEEIQSLKRINKQLMNKLLKGSE